MPVSQNLPQAFRTTKRLSSAKLLFSSLGFDLLILKYWSAMWWSACKPLSGDPLAPQFDLPYDVMGFGLQEFSLETFFFN